MSSSVLHKIAVREEVVPVPFCHINQLDRSTNVGQELAQRRRALEPQFVFWDAPTLWEGTRKHANARLLSVGRSVSARLEGHQGPDPGSRHCRDSVCGCAEILSLAGE
jgi:hypothetical protein